MITGFGHTTPGNPVALSKHSAKEELSAIDKGKWKTDLSTYAHLSAQDIHSGYLNRLYTSRDYEAGLVNLMKERYEVNICSFELLLFPYIPLQLLTLVSPKGRFINMNVSRDL